MASAAAGLAAVLALAGCGGGQNAADGKVTLKMVESLTNPTRTETLKKLISGFERENPDIKVDLISPPTDQADQKIQQMLQSGKGIDVVEARDITVGSFGANNWLYDMTKDLDGWDGWNNLTENAVTYSKQNGKTYYIPYGFYGLSLFYRSDLVKDAGFDGPPSSWSEMAEQAAALNKPSENKFGYAFRGGTNANSNAVAIIEAYVADEIDRENAFKLTSGKTIFSSPKAPGGDGPLHRPLQEGITAVVRGMGLPGDGPGLQQRLHSLPAAGPGGHRHGQGIEVHQGRPVERCSPAGGPGR
ncbi:hypothetical protein StoSoilB13_42340 (plasmid) [Arthrobacter sp. StoSoilB13]|nr:hypothetical protein StoSoilB13_42340 [Arthrobacter sp. StoSoilB13]